MVTRWVGILYLWREYDELVWGDMEHEMDLVVKIDIMYIYMHDRSLLIGWTCLVDGQCVNPWDL